MRKLRTGIPFKDYKVLFDNKEVIGGTQSEYYLLLKPALEQITDDTLKEMIASLDFFVTSNIFTKKKFVGSQVLVFQEYIKRVEKQEAFEEAKRKLDYEAQKEARERLNAFREAMMKDGTISGVVKENTESAQKDMYESMLIDELDNMIKWHGARSIEKSLEHDREGAAYHDKEAAFITDILIKKKKQEKDELEKQLFASIYGSSYPGARTASGAQVQSTQGDITLKGIQNMMKIIEDRMKKP